MSCEKKNCGRCRVCVYDMPKEQMQVLAVDRTVPAFCPYQLQETEGNYGVAVDLGTTTLAFALVDLDSEDIVRTYTSINQQRAYGQDIITRIERANAGEGEELQRLILRDMEEGLRSFMVPFEQIKQVAIAGNTTMCHLLLGYSCEGLGAAPFTPYRVVEEVFCGERFWKELSAEVYVFPCVSAFIGGDIVAGISMLEFAEDSTPKLLLDLGTNGEMVLWTGDRFVATSAAAGPALEGGHISCGCPSIQGAICDVTIVGAKNQVKTIGNLPPVGICGSGVLSAVSGLRSNGIIDQEGVFTETYLTQGYLLSSVNEKTICVTQEDIRQFQMAKSAIACGIAYLLDVVDDMSEIKVYLAGGLGVHLSVDAAIRTGLLPKGFRGKTIAAGNTSLRGAVQYLLEPKKQAKQMQTFLQLVEVISLADQVDFEDRFIDNLRFH